VGRARTPKDPKLTVLLLRPAPFLEGAHAFGVFAVAHGGEIGGEARRQLGRTLRQAKPPPIGDIGAGRKGPGAGPGKNCDRLVRVVELGKGGLQVYRNLLIDRVSFSGRLIERVVARPRCSTETTLMILSIPKINAVPRLPKTIAGLETSMQLIDHFVPLM
jgi:hypothetical protein